MDMPDSELRSLPRAGGTSAGGYYSLGADLLVALPQDDYVQTVSGARASLEELNRIAKACGRKQLLLVMVDSVRSQDAASRSVWQREIDPRYVCGLGLVCGSLLSRAIGAVFIRVRRPAVNTAMLPSLSAARDWATEQLATAGGAIDD
jgi:hypothetical protein